MEKQEIRLKIEHFLNETLINIMELKAFHRQLEKQNAHDIINDNDDQVMKDIEFLIRSSIILHSLGHKLEDCKLQLNAALGVLDSKNMVNNLS